MMSLHCNCIILTLIVASAWFLDGEFLNQQLIIIFLLLVPCAYSMLWLCVGWHGGWSAIMGYRVLLSAMW